MEPVEEDLYQGMCRGSLKDLDQYVRAGINVNHVFTCCKDQRVHGCTLLHVAVSQGKADMVRYLIDQDCEVDKPYRAISYHALTSRVRAKKYKDCLQLTCLYKAICAEDAMITKLLVDGGADVNCYDGRCCSAIWHAVDVNNQQIVNIILDASNCDVNSQDTLKLAPLHVASIHKNPAILQSLLEHGANVDLRQIQGASSLMLACTTGCVATVKVLLQHGADPNLRDDDGMTPLYCAIDKGHNAHVIYLLTFSGAYMYPGYFAHQHFHSTSFQANSELLQFVQDNFNMPVKLKDICSLKIKKILIHKSNGKSIYTMCKRLPLPRSLVDYLQLNNA